MAQFCSDRFDVLHPHPFDDPYAEDAGEVSEIECRPSRPDVRQCFFIAQRERGTPLDETGVIPGRIGREIQSVETADLGGIAVGGGHLEEMLDCPGEGGVER